MTKKLASGAVAGGVILFLWGAVSHMLLPFSGMALIPFKDEDAVTKALVSNAPRSGVYFLPYVEREGMTEEQQHAALEKATQGPVVFVSVRLGKAPTFTTLLVIQLLIEMLGALAVTALLMSARLTRYAHRVLFVVGVALVVGIAGSLPEWNWYNFSVAYTAVKFFNLLAGWALASLALARIVQPQ